VSDEAPYIDFENLPTPSEGFLVTQFITVRSVARSRAFYSDVLGGIRQPDDARVLFEGRLAEKRPEDLPG